MLGIWVSLAGGPVYTMSTHAVVRLIRQIADGYARDRVHCNALCPGLKFSFLFNLQIYFWDLEIRKR